MFYETPGPHGLPHNPFTSCVVPRPIGWITTLDERGVVNLAPFSFFNGVLSSPPMVMFSCSSMPSREQRHEKDTLANVTATREFVVNMATYALRDQVLATSAHVPVDVDELTMAGLTGVPSRIVKPPRVAELPVQLECRLYQIVELPPTGTLGKRNATVIGSVVGVHIDDDALTDGLIDIVKLRPLARLGYTHYCTVDSAFALDRPDRGDD